SRKCSHKYRPAAYYSLNARILHSWVFPGAGICTSQLCRLLLPLFVWRNILVSRSRLSIKRWITCEAKPTIIERKDIFFSYQLRSQNRIVLTTGYLSSSITGSLCLTAYIVCSIALKNITSLLQAILCPNYHNNRTHRSRLMFSAGFSFFLSLIFQLIVTWRPSN